MGRGRIILMGDSVAHGAGDESGGGGIAGRLGAINAGINGARTWNVMALLGRRSMRGILAEADAVVLSIGGNDLYGDTPARILAALAPGLAMRLAMMRVASIVATLEQANPRLRVYLLGLYDPYRRRDLDVRSRIGTPCCSAALRTMRA
jgi:lysophospholipase L1-like esterase